MKKLNNLTEKKLTKTFLLSIFKYLVIAILLSIFPFLLPLKDGIWVYILIGLNIVFQLAVCFLLTGSSVLEYSTLLKRHVEITLRINDLARRIDSDILKDFLKYKNQKTMNFGKALKALKKGKSVARSGWNGKGMYIYLNKGSFDGELLGFTPGEKVNSKHGSSIDGIKLGLFENGAKETVTRLPNINMKSATGSTVTGWLASQTDLLAEDWEIVE